MKDKIRKKKCVQIHRPTDRHWIRIIYAFHCMNINKFNIIKINSNWCTILNNVIKEAFIQQTQWHAWICSIYWSCVWLGWFVRRLAFKSIECWRRFVFRTLFLTSIQISKSSIIDFGSLFFFFSASLQFYQSEFLSNSIYSIDLAPLWAPISDGFTELFSNKSCTGLVKCSNNYNSGPTDE